MSENIYKETLYSENYGTDKPCCRVIVELEKVEIDVSTRFVLSADVTAFLNPRDDDGKTLYELELLLERYTSREKALRMAISMADDLKKRYEDKVEQ